MRGKKHTIKVSTGLMDRRVAPKGLMPKHWKKLVRPKTPPRMAPSTGPRMMAPMITGTVRKVISRPPKRM